MEARNPHTLDCCAVTAGTRRVAAACRDQQGCSCQKGRNAVASELAMLACPRKIGVEIDDSRSELHQLRHHQRGRTAVGSSHAFFIVPRGQLVSQGRLTQETRRAAHGLSRIGRSGTYCEVFVMSTTEPGGLGD